MDLDDSNLDERLKSVENMAKQVTEVCKLMDRLLNGMEKLYDMTTKVMTGVDAVHKRMDNVEMVQRSVEEKVKQTLLKQSPQKRGEDNEVARSFCEMDNNNHNNHNRITIWSRDVLIEEIWNVITERRRVKLHSYTRRRTWTSEWNYSQNMEHPALAISSSLTGTQKTREDSRNQQGKLSWVCGQELVKSIQSCGLGGKRGQINAGIMSIILI